MVQINFNPFSSTIPQTPQTGTTLKLLPQHGHSPAREQPHRPKDLPNRHPALEQAVPFLEALLAQANPSHYLEIRAITPQGKVSQYYHLIRDLFDKGMASALPCHLDGKANIYYGVCPRTRQEGTARAVEIATAAWFDEIKKVPPPDLPPFSWMVQTSTGQVQGGYFLKQPTRNLERVERLNRRLAVAVGGDNVGDRARVLRLPGFINCKYQGERAHLLELHAGGVL